MSPATSSTSRAEPAAGPVGVRFTEKMTGYISLGEADPWQGHDQGRQDDARLTFRLTISTEDVRRFVADPAHTAAAEGWVECEALGGRLAVERGEFHLFVADSPHRRKMLYRLWFHDGAGHPLTLRAHKVVTDDPGADVWADTTTLLTQILIGHVEAHTDASAVVTAAGVLRIRPLDFARQLTTFAASGPSTYARLAGLSTFGGFFLGQLWRVYGWRMRGRKAVRS